MLSVRVTFMSILMSSPSSGFFVWNWFLVGAPPRKSSGGHLRSRRFRPAASGGTSVLHFLVIAEASSVLGSRVFSSSGFCRLLLPLSPSRRLPIQRIGNVALNGFAGFRQNFRLRQAMPPPCRKTIYGLVNFVHHFSPTGISLHQLSWVMPANCSSEVMPRFDFFDGLGPNPANAVIE